MQSFGRAATVNNHVANLARKAFDVLRVVAIFATIAAAFREHLAVEQRHQNQRNETPRGYGCPDE